MRLVSWNIENLAPWLDGRADLAAHVAGALGAPDVLCLQEIRVRPRDPALVAHLHALLPGYTCHAALCDDPRNVTFRGGRAHGVATFVRQRRPDAGPRDTDVRSPREAATDAAVVAATPAWDREGRVVVVALPAQRLAIVNLYAVNGTTRPYVDPESGAPCGDRHAWKRRFQQQVLDLAAALRTTADVIVAGDWNVSRTAADVTPRLRTEEPHATARAQLNARLDGDGWVDAFRVRHPGARQYSWFGRTRTGALDAARVDYVVVSPSLMPRVTEAAILDGRALRPHSDHAPLVITLDGDAPAVATSRV